MSVTIDLGIVLGLVWFHFVADFVLQTDAMAKNKSKSWRWLTLHVATYALPFLWFGWLFALFNGVVHFVVDALSSRATSRLYARGEVHWFFVVIGMDQALHLTTLVGSYVWLEAMGYV